MNNGEQQEHDPLQAVGTDGIYKIDGIGENKEVGSYSYGNAD